MGRNVCLPWMRPPRSTQLGRRPERRSRVKGRRAELRAAGTGSAVAPQGGAGEQVQQAWGAATGTRSRGGAFSSSIWSPGRGSSLAPAALSSDLSLAPWSVAWEGAARPSRSLGRGRGWRGAAETGRGENFCYILVAKASNFIEVSWGGL